jgi:AraC-like DNA-binding protein
MEYRQWDPIPELTPLVDCLWSLTGHTADLSAPLQPVLPDGRPELILHFGDPFERARADGTFEQQGRRLFAGQLTEQLILRPTGRIDVLGIRFHPCGAAALVETPQQVLAGLTLRVDDMSTTLEGALAGVQQRSATLEDAAALVQQLLVGHLRPARVDLRVRLAADEITARNGLVSVEAVADRVGLTRRHLERRFLETVGVSPKRLARIARFQHALRMLESNDAPRHGAQTAAACGYADQSHFIRDFRDLAGCSPSAHLLREAELNGFFIERPR